MEELREVRAEVDEKCVYIWDSCGIRGCKMGLREGKRSDRTSSLNMC